MEIRSVEKVFSFYFALAGVVAALLGFRCALFWNAARFILGWAVCYVPFYLVPRVMYQYHYCIGS
jgi:dolichyl-phosphate-mannose--protein O-mannosyl transferase